MRKENKKSRRSRNSTVNTFALDQEGKTIVLSKLKLLLRDLNY